jgi:hypothetical protein
VGSAINDHHNVVSRQFGLTPNETEGADTWSNAHLAVDLLRREWR